MKLIVMRNSGKITAVHTMDYYTNRGKTEQEVLDRLIAYNEEGGTYTAEIHEFDNSLSDVFQFLLSEGMYKSYATIDRLYERVGEMVASLGSTLHEVEDVADEVRYEMERLKKEK